PVQLTALPLSHSYSCSCSCSCSSFAGPERLNARTPERLNARTPERLNARTPEEPMSDTCCPFIKPDGAPCAAHPLPNSNFCLFHHPDHQQALAESRSKGGSTPRRRTRRFPRLLDHVHVAELLGELFIEIGRASCRESGRS